MKILVCVGRRPPSFLDVYGTRINRLKRKFEEIRRRYGEMTDPGFRFGSGSVNDLGEAALWIGG